MKASWPGPNHRDTAPFVQARKLPPPVTIVDSDIPPNPHWARPILAQPDQRSQSLGKAPGVIGTDLTLKGSQSLPSDLAIPRAGVTRAKCRVDPGRRGAGSLLAIGMILRLREP